MGQDLEHNIPIVYEDDWILIADKPAGLLTVPTPRREKRTLTSILNLYPCHRLDRDTSGLIVYSKVKSVQKKMMDEFRHKNVKKTYIAFVRGAIMKNSGRIDMPIAGAYAATEYKVIQKKKDFTVLEVYPLTGRTNQIRIHFKNIGCPLLGENRFAFRRDFKLKAKRLCLHAKGLKFFHPITRKFLSLSTPLPKDMQDFLDKH